MRSNAYLKYNPDDFDANAKIFSNNYIELPSIAKPHNDFLTNVQPTFDPIIYPDTSHDFEKQAFKKEYFGAALLEVDQVFWKIFLWIALLPLLNSAITNVYFLSKNIFHNVELRSEYKKLNLDRDELLGKMKEYHSVSGMKRTIKEEIKALEENEVLVKILAD